MFDSLRYDGNHRFIWGDEYGSIRADSLTYVPIGKQSVEIIHRSEYDEKRKVEVMAYYIVYYDNMNEPLWRNKKIAEIDLDQDKISLERDKEIVDKYIHSVVLNYLNDNKMVSKRAHVKRPENIKLSRIKSIKHKRVTPVKRGLLQRLVDFIGRI